MSNQPNNAHQAEQREALAVALRALGVREHNELELREKLKLRNYDGIIIDNVIEQLKYYDYLNEFRYAESFLRSRLHKGETPRVAAYKAKQRGADADALQIAIEEAEGHFDAYDACKTVLDKRDPTGLRKQNQRVWQRQMRYLQSKGYDISTILQVMNEDEA